MSVTKTNKLVTSKNLGTLADTRILEHPGIFDEEREMKMNLYVGIRKKQTAPRIPMNRRRLKDVEGFQEI